MNQRRENSLETAARWAGNLVTLYVVFSVFTLVAGSVVWCIGNLPHQCKSFLPNCSSATISKRYTVC